MTRRAQLSRSVARLPPALSLSICFIRREENARVTAHTASHTRELIRDCFPPESRTDQSVKSLTARLMRFIEASDLRSRLDAFVKLKEWTASSALSSSPLARVVALATAGFNEIGKAIAHDSVPGSRAGRHLDPRDRPRRK